MILVLRYYHGKTVTNPKTVPIRRAIRNINRLTVDGDNVRREVADDASADVVGDFISLDSHHGDRVGSRQPERFVVSGCVIAEVHAVAEHERHRAEEFNARTRPS